MHISAVLLLPIAGWAYLGAATGEATFKSPHTLHELRNALSNLGIDGRKALPTYPSSKNGPNAANASHDCTACVGTLKISWVFTSCRNELFTDRTAIPV